ncbi:hypothetical protein DL991_12760 [Amycolatopsis sp. WAC 01375]|uniref:hypothetical protein n=1 Tax=unclassified Amycolatopsis TaxID=2618356 RepID=UPI000F76C8D9|nr:MULTISPECIES: hypothetical protein [unclassified Amycolatopsis]RSM79678.1 hypothetical protein DL991_12760 [Amycolatopsis sp. WAC 01375]RSN27484.1 hypothetical protein DL990_30370 [Amycolatopsis sp. WAC 01416]
MEFVVADDDVWLSAFGVLPQAEEASDDDWVRELRVPVSVTGELHLSWDVLHQSVRVRYTWASDLIVDVYREQATLLTVDDRKTGPVVVLEYYAEGCRGRAFVRTQPTLALEDTFLRT